MLDQDTILDARGGNVVNSNGDKIGTVEDIYLDGETNKPEWVAVNTGLFGTRSTFVPLAEASSQGSDITVPYDKDTVKGAPHVDAGGELSQQQEAELYGYYGLEYSDDRSDSGLPEGGTDVRDTSEGYDVSGPTTDDAMTRSEEELRVGKTQREAGRARLRKYVVSEQQTQTVPLQREEVRVEREPVTDANLDAALSGPEISEEEHEVVLREEEPVVEKRAVPKERVRMTTDTVMDEEQVSGDVRKEEIEVEGDVRR